MSRVFQSTKSRNSLNIEEFLSQYGFRRTSPTNACNFTNGSFVIKGTMKSRKKVWVWRFYFNYNTNDKVEFSNIEDLRKFVTQYYSKKEIDLNEAETNSAGRMS
jgi:hypothetical protein